MSTTPTLISAESNLEDTCVQISNQVIMLKERIDMLQAEHTKLINNYMHGQIVKANEASFENMNSNMRERLITNAMMTASELQQKNNEAVNIDLGFIPDEQELKYIRLQYNLAWPEQFLTENDDDNTVYKVNGTVIEFAARND